MSDWEPKCLAIALTEFTTKCDEEPKIWENAFLDDSKYTKSSDDYIISFETYQVD